jgi:uncharacterized protein
MNYLYFAISFAVILAGLAGTVLPVLPGIALIYAGYLLYGFLSSWQAYGLPTMAIWGIVTLLSLVVDHYGAMYGARRSGSSILGIWGSFVGAIIGIVLFHLVGLIVGTFLGAVAGELLSGRSIGHAFASGKAALIGFLAGSLVKVVTGLVMTGTFFWQVFGAARM